MALPRDTKLREFHRSEIARFYLQGITQIEMAERLGINKNTVTADLKIIQARWRESALVDINEARQIEMARIDQLEREYWRAWENSLRDKITAYTNNQRGNSGKKEQQFGDPRYLQGVQWCIEKRCKILGIDAPDKIEINWQSEFQSIGFDPSEEFEKLVQHYVDQGSP